MLSAYLHIPEVYFGGDHAYLFGRYVVWVQWAFIAWFWVKIAMHLMPSVRWNRFDQVGVALIAFISSAQTFPPMPWYTIDGVFLMSLGLYWITLDASGLAMVGYMVVGMSYLCKPNFFFIGPLVLVFTGGSRRFRAWLAWSLPGFLYFALLNRSHAFRAGVFQILSQPTALRTAVLPYVRTASFHVASVAGFLASGMLLVKSERWKWPRTVAFSQGLIFMLAPLLTFGGDNFIGFGAALGIWAGLIFDQEKRRTAFVLGGLAVALAWCVSISIGWNTPDLGMGAISVFFMALAWDRWQKSPLPAWLRVVIRVLLVAEMLCFVLWFHDLRRQEVYMDRSADELTYSLDGVWPGGRGIKTNENTYAFLVDLQTIIHGLNGHPYAILPDCPGYWAKAPQVNRLPIDWLWPTEISQKPMVERVDESLLHQKGRITLVVQKFWAFNLKDGDVPIQFHPVIIYVREHFRKVRETKYFEVYE